jgi:hypothetical protein
LPNNYHETATHITTLLYTLRRSIQFLFNKGFGRDRKTAKKETVSFFISVRPSLRAEQLGCHWVDFHEILCSSSFRKSVKKVYVSLKCTSHEGQYTYLIISRSVLLKTRKFSNKVVEKTKTHIFCSLTVFFLKLCRL